MRYDTCNRCPLNEQCEKEFKKQEKAKKHKQKQNTISK